MNLLEKEEETVKSDKSWSLFSLDKNCSIIFFFSTLIFPRIGSALRPRFLIYVQYWHDAGILTRVDATAARCATTRLHTSLMSYTHIIMFYKISEFGS